MSDMIETYRALDEHRKVERQAKAEVNIQSLQALGITAVEQTKNVFRVSGWAGVVMYYPTSGKWQHRGRVYKGSVFEFQTWLRG